MQRAVIVGCGLGGVVIARYLAEKNIQVIIWEKRNHIGVNMYDYVDDLGSPLFKNDYEPYTVKRWGVSSDKIDTSVLKRVLIRFSYDVGYFDDFYQVMPMHLFTYFFEKLLDHPNISLELNKDTFSFEDRVIRVNGM